MRCLFAILLVLMLAPGMAQAQRLADVDKQQAAQRTPGWQQETEAWLVPLWRTPDGQLMTASRDQWVRSPLRIEASSEGLGSGEVLDLTASQMTSVGLAVGSPSRLYSSVRLNSIFRSAPSDISCSLLGTDCAQGWQAWRGGSVLGGYRGDDFLIDIGVDWLQHNQRPAGWYLVLPMDQSSSLMGVPSRWVESLNRIQATGRLELGDSGAHLEMGASIGRMRLMPGHVRAFQPDDTWLLRNPGTNLDSIDQKTVSVGLGAGAVSGMLVGRVMQPQGSDALSSGQLHRWSAVDLGITVRLPWEGELSLGAKNLWSSGNEDRLPSQETDPIQGRIPYIRYHQNL